MLLISSLIQSEIAKVPTKEQYQINKDKYRQQNKAYRQKFPWYDCWRNAHARCEDPRNKNYNRLKAAGITCDLTKDQVAILWKRDNGASLIIPSIDRIEPKKNYTFDNCRFIEFIENVHRRTNPEKFETEQPIISEAEKAWA